MSKSIEKRGDAVRIEVPADRAATVAPLWGLEKFAPIFNEKPFRSWLSPQSFYLFDVIPYPSFGSGQTLAPMTDGWPSRISRPRKTHITLVGIPESDRSSGP